MPWDPTPTNKKNAKAIIAKKKSQNLWRAHPEVPDCLEAIQYWVFKGEGETAGKNKIGRRALKLEGEMDKPAAAMALSSFGAGPSSSSIDPSAGEAVAEKAAKEAAEKAAKEAEAAEKAEKAAEKEARKEAEKAQKIQERHLSL